MAEGDRSRAYDRACQQEGREARIGVTVYERGVCTTTSADAWAREAVNPTPASEALKRHTEGIRSTGSERGRSRPESQPTLGPSSS